MLSIKNLLSGKAGGGNKSNTCLPLGGKSLALSYDNNF